MASLFELAADCGPLKGQASRLAEHFNGRSVRVSDGELLSCDVSDSDIWLASDGHWWCRVVPSGVSLGSVGGPSVTNPEIICEVARHLYARLRETDAFRCARVGWEVEESLDDSDWDRAKVNPLSLPLGTVVDREYWIALGSPTILEPFGASSFWRPLSDADYLSIVSWL